MKERKENTYVLLPSGEWFESILQTFALANLALQSPSPRFYRYEFADSDVDLQISFVVARTKEVQLLADNSETTAWIGLTGSDFIRENGLPDCTPFPLLNRPQRTKIYLGTTQRYPGDVNNKLNFRGATILTTYPNIAKWYLKQIGQEDVVVESLNGKIEGIGTIWPKLWGIVDVSESEETARVNGIAIRDTIMYPEVVYYISPQAPEIDIQRVLELQERINQVISGRS